MLRKISKDFYHVKSRKINHILVLLTIIVFLSLIILIANNLEVAYCFLLLKI
jgi:hypothetical protein